MSRSLQMSQQEVSAAAEKLTVRELNIRTLHNGNLILSYPRLQWNTSLVSSFYSMPCDAETEEFKSRSV